VVLAAYCISTNASTSHGNDDTKVCSPIGLAETTLESGGKTSVKPWGRVVAATHAVTDDESVDTVAQFVAAVASVTTTTTLKPIARDHTCCRNRGLKQTREQERTPILSIFLVAMLISTPGINVFPPLAVPDEK
jgi:hypothetical protein